jgi:hypothetical protein
MTTAKHITMDQVTADLVFLVAVTMAITIHHVMHKTFKRLEQVAAATTVIFNPDTMECTEFA